MQHSPALQQIDARSITSTSPPWPPIATSNSQHFIVRIDAVDDGRKASRCSSEGRRKGPPPKGGEAPRGDASPAFSGASMMKECGIVGLDISSAWRGRVPAKCCNRWIIV